MRIKSDKIQHLVSQLNFLSCWIVLHHIIDWHHARSILHQTFFLDQWQFSHQELSLCIFVLFWIIFSRSTTFLPWCFQNRHSFCKIILCPGANKNSQTVCRVPWVRNHSQFVVPVSVYFVVSLLFLHPDISQFMLRGATNQKLFRGRILLFKVWRFYFWMAPSKGETAQSYSLLWLLNFTGADPKGFLFNFRMWSRSDVNATSHLIHNKNTSFLWRYATCPIWQTLDLIRSAWTDEWMFHFIHTAVLSPPESWPLHPCRHGEDPKRMCTQLSVIKIQEKREFETSQLVLVLQQLGEVLKKNLLLNYAINKKFAQLSGENILLFQREVVRYLNHLICKSFKFLAEVRTSGADVQAARHPRS